MGHICQFNLVFPFLVNQICQIIFECVLVMFFMEYKLKFSIYVPFKKNTSIIIVNHLCEVHTCIANWLEKKMVKIHKLSIQI